MIRIVDLATKLGDFELELSLEAQDGELLSVLGPSGSGKSTLLYLIAGFLPPDSGSVFFDDRDVTETPIEDRNIGFVFQDYALFEHLNVEGNISYGLRRRRWTQRERTARVQEMLSVVGLEEFGNRPVSRLSGGERQRVALARALAPKPDLLLLDEPLSALDAGLRRNLRRLLKRVQQSTNTTTLYVTHDQEEALSLSDRIAVLRDGKLQGIDTPDALYQNPSNRWTAEFLGRANFVTGRVSGVGKDDLRVEMESGRILRVNPHVDTGVGPELDVGNVATLFFRPEWCVLETDKSKQNAFTGRVVLAEYNGRGSEITIDMGETQLVAWLFDTAPSELGETVTVAVPPDRLRLL